MGLSKVNGKGKINTCANPRSDTTQVIIGNGTFVGKAAKGAHYLKAARLHWEAKTNGSQKSTVGHQKPGSIKCR